MMVNSYNNLLLLMSDACHLFGTVFSSFVFNSSVIYLKSIVLRLLVVLFTYVYPGDNFPCTKKDHFEVF